MKMNILDEKTLEIYDSFLDMKDSLYFSMFELKSLIKNYCVEYTLEVLFDEIL